MAPWRRSLPVWFVRPSNGSAEPRSSAADVWGYAVGFASHSLAVVIPGRAAGAGPESITTGRAWPLGHSRQQDGARLSLFAANAAGRKRGDYGFRARRFAAPRNDDGGSDTRLHSRGAFRPSLASTEPSKKGGRRECRVQAAPASLACKGSALYARKQPQGSQNNRHSLRNGLRLIRDLPGVRA